MRAVRRARNRGRIDDATAEALLEQLERRTARVRLIGNPNTNYYGIPELVPGGSGFRMLPGPNGVMQI